jgi:hypothetical protein
MPRLYVSALIATLMLALVPVTLSAQRITRRIFVNAVSGAGSPVLDLTAADFDVLENDAKREVTRAALGNAPMRIVLLVDSSTTMGPMINSFRAALNAFLDALPPEHEITFISTGGQIRIRAQTTIDRAKLKMEAGRFSSDGGANSFIDTLLESDRRFLKPAPAQWPVFVILNTDSGETLVEPRVDDYNKFMADFLLRGGSAHGVVVRGRNTGPVTDFTQNLVQNTGGLLDVINLDSVLPERLKTIAERLAADHRTMITRYELEYASDAKVQQPRIQVGVSRPGVKLNMSPRRPF